MMLRSSSSPVLACMNEAIRNPILPSTSRNNVFNPIPSSLKQSILPRKTHLTRTISSDYLNSTIAPRGASQADSPVRFRELEPVSEALQPPTLVKNGRKEGDAEEEFSFSLPSFSDVDIIEGKEVTVLGLFDLWNGAEKGSSQKQPVSAMYMAAGLGMHQILTISGSESFDTQTLERHFEKIVEENPFDALVLRNYAQFLHKRKGDYRKAEEFYSRAILADPNDGEILSDYAILRWEEHRDDDMTVGFFDRALELAPQNSHIQAAYALFLWEANGRNSEQEGRRSQHQSKDACPRIHLKDPCLYR